MILAIICYVIAVVVGAFLTAVKIPAFGDLLIGWNLPIPKELDNRLFYVLIAVDAVILAIAIVLTVLPARKKRFKKEQQAKENQKLSRKAENVKRMIQDALNGGKDVIYGRVRLIREKLGTPEAKEKAKKVGIVTLILLPFVALLSLLGKQPKKSEPKSVTYNFFFKN